MIIAQNHFHPSLRLVHFRCRIQHVLRHSLVSSKPLPRSGSRSVEPADQVDRRRAEVGLLKDEASLYQSRTITFKLYFSWPVSSLGGCRGELGVEVGKEEA